MINIIRIFLWPFSLIYGLLVFFRNKAYDLGIFKSYTFPIPTLCIGNLAIGGSGKTPATEYLVELLKDYKIAILSRGYGRRTKGFILAKDGVTAADIGDEPLQYFHKFKQVTVAVCEDRVEGVKKLMQDHDLILLDDAYQHRRLASGYKILLFEFDKLLKPQFLLPTGYLREPLWARQRANAILVTKSPSHINTMDRIAIHKKLDMDAGQRISFAHIAYGQLIAVYGQSIPSLQIETKVYLLTGIANPEPLKQYIGQLVDQVITFTYPDHHEFKKAEIAALAEKFQQDSCPEKVIITTEKDSKRLLSTEIKDLLLNLPIAYIPIKMELAKKDKTAFEEKILDYVKSTKRIS